MKPFASTDPENLLADAHHAHTIAGLDEVGRGALAGPLVIGCVVRKRSTRLDQLKDSKQLSQRKRHTLLPNIFSHIECWSVGIVDADDITTHGMTWALHTGFQRALMQLPVNPDLVLYDGRTIAALHPHAKAIIRGDETHATIAAASILAKVIRDLFMDDMHDDFPEYNFESNKGYGTLQHRIAIQQHGTIPHVHRPSFVHVSPDLSPAPVQ